MISGKAVPKGLMWIECECGVGGKNSLICYIPEQDPVQDTLEKSKKTTHFKLNFKLKLSHTRNELKVAI